MFIRRFVGIPIKIVAQILFSSKTHHKSTVATIFSPLSLSPLLVTGLTENLLDKGVGFRFS